MGGIAGMPVADPLIGAAYTDYPLPHLWDYWYGFRSATAARIYGYATTPVGGTTGGALVQQKRAVDFPVVARRNMRFTNSEMLALT